ncbi:hypothetical protein LPMP_202880 [Leishmania panamensis]|uniref:Uncharacterized protein n=1 Tax=Leishmania panamensis TaxID=5679 RepID=A0A088RRE0_LEIPA|nr:hypothetical protein LPMP_202880 [Leishmania panamensis]AIN97784.1 hypothetical protein LPMP_202880 [Leishmania panamensis]
MTAVPTALWIARFSEWSAAPKYLKSKMLQEAEQLTVYMQEKAARHLAKAAAAPTDLSKSCQLRDGGTISKCTTGTTVRVASLVGNERCTHGVEVLATASRHGNESLHRCSAAAQENEMDAATPTTKSQQQQQQQQQQQLAVRTASSPSNFFVGRKQTRNVSGVMGSGPEAPAAQEHGGVVAGVCFAHSASQQQQHSRGSEALSQNAAPPPLRDSALQRPSCDATRYSLVTYSETIDDKLNDALLHLENCGNEVGEALVKRRDKAALLLGVMDEELSGTRRSSSEVMESTSQRTGLDNGEEQRGNVEGKKVTSTQGSKRRREQAGCSGLPASSGGHRVCREGGEAHYLSQRSTPKSIRGGGLLPLLRDDAQHAPPPPHLTRADIRRPHSHQPPQEDSQVVYFDH